MRFLIKLPIIVMIFFGFSIVFLEKIYAEETIKKLYSTLKDLEKEKAYRNTNGFNIRKTLLAELSQLNNDVKNDPVNQSPKQQESTKEQNIEQKTVVEPKQEEPTKNLQNETPQEVQNIQGLESTKNAPENLKKTLETMESLENEGNESRFNPIFLPQLVNYKTQYAPGTIMIDSSKNFLYFIEEGGKARRYGVGVGREDMSWTGTEVVSRKEEWPDWRPPAEMINRERKKGRKLKTFVPGGMSNPLGARALYLGATLYRIHGTNAPWTIGKKITSGCIRMRNEDIEDLYARVKLGAKVVVM